MQASVSLLGGGGENTGPCQSTIGGIQASVSLLGKGEGGGDTGLCQSTMGGIQASVSLQGVYRPLLVYWGGIQASISLLGGGKVQYCSNPPFLFT